MKKLIWALWIMSLSVYADPMQSKVIQLHYVQADQVLALLNPLLNDGEKISGTGQTIVVKASPDTLTQIRNALHKIDVPPVTFNVWVYQGDPQMLSDQNQNTVTYSTQPRQEAVRSQSVNVVNGGAAVISMNEEVPIVSSVGVGWFTGVNYQQHQIKNGFVVQPTLQGSQVKLTIQKMRDQENPAGGQQFDNQQYATTMMVPMNKWVLIGSAMGAEPVDNNSVSYSAGNSYQQNSSLYIKITVVGGASDSF